MAKTLIALAASPNKSGNSDTLLEAFLEGVIEVTPKIKVEKVYLYDLDCAPMEHKTKNPLDTETRFEALGDSLKGSAGLVIATSQPSNFSVPGVLKNFVDRIGYMTLDYRTPNKIGQPTGQLGHLRTFFIVTGGTPNMARRLLFFLFPGLWLSVIFKYYYAKLGGSLYAGGLTFTNPAKDRPKLLARAKKRGMRYAKKYLS